ncbi:MAG: cation:proton antiporter [Burkholderiales bacterium]|nr:cation:proton antiporter [Burkholderiales bacterium]
MTTELMLMAIAACVLLSYWFSYLARVLRFPSVVFLIFTGLALRQVTDATGHTVGLPQGLLPLLGTIGLIMIVLEGALDLDLQPGRRGFLLRTLSSAIVGVALMTAVLGAAISAVLDLPLLHAAMMATPFAVISSAVAIPSSEVLPRAEREFVIHESSWSDIFGVMLLNALVAAGDDGGFARSLLVGGFAVVLLGAILGLAMVWLVGHLQGHVKFLPLIFALLLVYGAAKALQLSPLLIVLVLGLMLNNRHLILRFALLRRLDSDHYEVELGKLKHLTAEATFLVRTFFFLLLGYSTDTAHLIDPWSWIVAIAIVLMAFGLRVPVLHWLAARPTRPLVWVAPRGLVTVLLFFSLPAGLVPERFPPGVLILVVLLSCTVMAIGLLHDGRRKGADAAEPAAAPAAGDAGAAVSADEGIAGPPP